MNSKRSGERTQEIWGELITLGQLIKLLSLIGSGAEVKEFLAETRIDVNGEPENRRGRKLYPGDLISISGQIPVRLTSKT
jgi:ribosome-associated protein